MSGDVVVELRKGVCATSKICVQTKVLVESEEDDEELGSTLCTMPHLILGAGHDLLLIPQSRESVRAAARLCVESAQRKLSQLPEWRKVA